MTPKDTLFRDIVIHMDDMLADKSERGMLLWGQFIKLHKVDIADFIKTQLEDIQKKILGKLHPSQRYKVFEKLPHLTQVSLLKSLETPITTDILKHMHSDRLVDLLSHMSDESLTQYLELLQKKQRQQVTSQLSFQPKSAGAIMNSDVLTFTDDMTVNKAIDLLQRVCPEKELRYRIFITNKENKLVGYMTLDQLVLNKPDTPLQAIIKKPIIAIQSHEPQEAVASKMAHYDLLSVPVVDRSEHFLGTITGDDVFDVIEEEASEEIYRMSGVGEVTHSYFETPVKTMFFERSKWLVGLLLLQSFSSFIMGRFEDMLNQHVIISLFLTMLIGTGGNAGNQSATLVIRGLATGEIPRSKGLLVLIRELAVGIMISGLLSLVSFLRVFIIYHSFINALAISLSLFFIVLTSIVMGSLIPLILERFNIDPAHSAAPFLSTLMDIIGITIYCLICSKMLG